MGNHVNVAEHYDVRHVELTKYTVDEFRALLESAEAVREDLVSWHNDDRTAFELDMDGLFWLRNHEAPPLAQWAESILGLGDPDNDFIRVELY